MIMIQFLMTEEYAENGKIGRRKEGTVRSKKGRKKSKEAKRMSWLRQKGDRKKELEEKVVRERIIDSDLKTPIASNVATV